MSDLVRNPNCWFSHAQAQLCYKIISVNIIDFFVLADIFYRMFDFYLFIQNLQVAGISINIILLSLLNVQTVYTAKLNIEQNFDLKLHLN